MKKNEHVPDPIPREWLPASPVAPEQDETYWNARLRSLMGEAEPVLAEYRRPRRRVSWLDALATRWRPAVGGAFAFAASLVLALVLGAGRGGSQAQGTRPEPRAMVLATVVSGGEPAVLWRSAGVPADPTLALMALETGTGSEGGRQ